jgi:hypothetical protein
MTPSINRSASGESLGDAGDALSGARGGGPEPSAMLDTLVLRAPI